MKNHFSHFGTNSPSIQSSFFRIPSQKSYCDFCAGHQSALRRHFATNYFCNKVSYRLGFHLHSFEKNHPHSHAMFPYTVSFQPASTHHDNAFVYNSLLVHLVNLRLEPCFISHAIVKAWIMLICYYSNLCFYKIIAPPYQHPYFSAWLTNIYCHSIHSIFVHQFISFKHIDLISIPTHPKLQFSFENKVLHHSSTPSFPSAPWSPLTGPTLPFSHPNALYYHLSPHDFAAHPPEDEPQPHLPKDTVNSCKNLGTFENHLV